MFTRYFRKAVNCLSVPQSRYFLGIIPWYGLLIVTGAVLAVFLADREAKRISLPSDTILDLALRVLPIGILGARLYYVLFSWPSFVSRPLSILFIWEGGLAIYGGLIAGFIVSAWFCRKRKISFPLLLDLLVPGVALAQAIGRWGNYFNQEAYGIALSPDSVFSFFPLAVQIPSSTGLRWHVAAFFLESVWDFLIFLFLMIGRRKLFRRKGDLFLWYLLAYGAGRLVIENLRTDSLYMGSTVRVSQLLSVLFCLAVAVFFFLQRRRETGRISLPSAIALCVAVLFSFVSILFCVGIIHFNSDSIVSQMVFLSVYAVLMILSGFILYGKSKPQEVLYACHKMG